MRSITKSQKSNGIYTKQYKCGEMSYVDENLHTIGNSETGFDVDLRFQIGFQNGFLHGMDFRILFESLVIL